MKAIAIGLLLFSVAALASNDLVLATNTSVGTQITNGTAPYNAVADYRIDLEACLTAPASGTAVVFQVEVGGFHLAYSASGSVIFTDVVANTGPYLTATSGRCYKQRIRRVGTTLQMILWDTVTGVQTKNSATISGTARNMYGWLAVGGIYGGATPAGNVRYIRWYSSAGSENDPPPARTGAPVGDLLNLEFEHSGSTLPVDSSPRNRAFSTITGTPSYAAAVETAPAVVTAATPSTVRAGASASFDATASFANADNAVVSCLWNTLPPALQGRWIGRNNCSAAWLAPLLGEYTLRLTVTDAAGRIATKDITVGAVPTDANNVVVVPDAQVAKVLGPLIRHGANPWTWADDRHAKLADIIRTSKDYWARNDMPWDIAGPGQIRMTSNSTVEGTGTNFRGDFCDDSGNALNQTQPLIVWYSSADYPGTYGRLLTWPGACADDTHMDVQWGEYEKLGLGTISYPTAWMSYSHFKVGSPDEHWKTTNINPSYYDSSILNPYMQYWRSGQESYRTTAREMADAIWRAPYIDRGRGPGNNAWKETRSMPVLGLMLRAQDGRPEMWVGLRVLRSWLAQTGWGEHRQFGYAIGYLAAGALLDPDATERANWKTALAGRLTTVLEPLSTPGSGIVPTALNSYHASWPSAGGCGQGSLVSISTSGTLIQRVSGDPKFGSCAPVDTSDDWWNLWFTPTGIVAPASNAEGDPRVYKYTWFETKLAAGINASQTTFDVLDGSVLFVGEPFTIDAERMMVTAKTGNSITVTRAYGGTTAASHTTTPRLVNDWRLTLAEPYQRAGCSPCTMGWSVFGSQGYGILGYMLGMYTQGMYLAYEAFQLHGDTANMEKARLWIQDAVALLRTTVYTPADKGFKTGILYVPCTPQDNDTPAGAKFMCNKGARYNSGEGLPGLVFGYLVNPTQAVKDVADEAYTGLYGKPGWSAPYTGDAEYIPLDDGAFMIQTDGNGKLVDPTRNKFIGTFCGWGRCSTWPAARLGGVQPAISRAVSIGFNLASVPNATQVRCSLSKPDGTTVQATTATSPCSVTGDARQGEHGITLEYLSAGGAVLASSSEPGPAPVQ